MMDELFFLFKITEEGFRIKKRTVQPFPEILKGEMVADVMIEDAVQQQKPRSMSHVS